MIVSAMKERKMSYEFLQKKNETEYVMFNWGRKKKKKKVSTAILRR